MDWSSIIAAVLVTTVISGLLIVFSKMKERKNRILRNIFLDEFENNPLLLDNIDPTDFETKGEQSDFFNRLREWNPRAKIHCDYYIDQFDREYIRYSMDFPDMDLCIVELIQNVCKSDRPPEELLRYFLGAGPYTDEEEALLSDFLSKLSFLDVGQNRYICQYHVMQPMPSPDALAELIPKVDLFLQHRYSGPVNTIAGSILLLLAVAAFTGHTIMLLNTFSASGLLSGICYVLLAAAFLFLGRGMFCLQKPWRNLWHIIPGTLLFGGIVVFSDLMWSYLNYYGYLLLTEGLSKVDTFAHFADVCLRRGYCIGILGYILITLAFAGIQIGNLLWVKKRHCTPMFSFFREGEGKLL